MEPCICEATLIGVCQSAIHYHCATSETDCNNDEYYLKTNSACSCSGSLNMLTLYGACQSSSEFFCAYSSDYCQQDYHTWISPIQVLEELGEECTCDKTRTGGCYG